MALRKKAAAAESKTKLSDFAEWFWHELRGDPNNRVADIGHYLDRAGYPRHAASVVHEPEPAPAAEGADA